MTVVIPKRVAMTDADFLCAVLSDGKPHTTNEILQASFKERGCGMTVHSRASDLRNKRHLNIVCRSVGKVGRRNVFEYQLVSLREPQSDVQFRERDKRNGTDAGRGSQRESFSAAGATLPFSPLGAAPAQLQIEDESRSDGSPSSRVAVASDSEGV